MVAGDESSPGIDGSDNLCRPLASALTSASSDGLSWRDGDHNPPDGLGPIPLKRPLAAIAAIPVLCVLAKCFRWECSHPIWKSAETALGHPVAGDPGASVIALGQYLFMIAVAFLSAVVAVDRQRAEWILFALTVAVTAIALIMLTHELFFPGVWAPAIEAPRCKLLPTPSAREEAARWPRAKASYSGCRPR